MSEIRNLGKINIKILEKEFGKIQTDEIIVTNERIDHIKERHPEDYNLFEKYGKESVSSPDLIIKDVKNKSTVFIRNQRIIAGNAQFAGIAAGRGVRFTTGLLLLGKGLGMRETPIRPHSWH